MKKKILSHFKKQDPLLFSLAKRVDFDTLEPRDSDQYFYSLCYNIIGQQLTGKVVKIIFNRFESLFPGKKLDPKIILNIPEQEIRDVGASWAKVRSLKDLSQKIIDKEISLDKLAELSDDEVIENLVKVKGIGPWTAEMFLMFTLGRKDIFSVRDLGLRKGTIKLHSLDNNVSLEEIERIAKVWSPYRTYASFVLWKGLDGEFIF